MNYNCIALNYNCIFHPNDGPSTGSKSYKLVVFDSIGTPPPPPPLEVTLRTRLDEELVSESSALDTYMHLLSVLTFFG